MSERKLSSRALRQREITTAQRLATAKFLEESAGAFAWYPNNAQLRGGDYSFESWFRCVLPEGRTDMREYVEETLAPLERRMGLELGGPGSNFFAGFTPGYFTATAGANFTDTRITRAYPKSSQTMIDADNARNHRVIPGNILSDALKEDVLTWLGGSRAAFIAERMHFGIRSLPKDPFFMSKEASFWYDEVLGRGGLMLAQVPNGFYRVIKEWETYCKEYHANSIEVQVDKNMENKYVARLHKLTDAPLPLLDIHDVLRKERERYKRLR